MHELELVGRCREREIENQKTKNSIKFCHYKWKRRAIFDFDCTIFECWIASVSHQMIISAWKFHPNVGHLWKMISGINHWQRTTVATAEASRRLTDYPDLSDNKNDSRMAWNMMSSHDTWNTIRMFWFEYCFQCVQCVRAFTKLACNSRAENMRQFHTRSTWFIASLERITFNDQMTYSLRLCVSVVMNMNPIRSIYLLHKTESKDPISLMERRRFLVPFIRSEEKHKVRYLQLSYVCANGDATLNLSSSRTHSEIELFIRAAGLFSSGN